MREAGQSATHTLRIWPIDADHLDLVAHEHLLLDFLEQATGHTQQVAEGRSLATCCVVNPDRVEIALARPDLGQHSL